MALQKSNININFSQGLDLKSDPFQVAPGHFLALQNSIFTKAGLLTKRNGFGSLPTLPDATNTYTTTFNGNLTAIGTSLEAYSSGSNSWVNKGTIQPVALEVLPLIRSNTNQSQCDSAIASNGFICTVYTDNIPSGGSTSPVYKYVVADSTTGQNIVAPTVISVPTGTVSGAPRVFLLGNYFVIVFTNLISATYHLYYIAVTVTAPQIATVAANITSQYTPNTQMAFDGAVANNRLYLAWNGSDLGNAIRMTYITPGLSQANTVTFAGQVATMMSVCVDTTQNTPIIYATYYDSGSSTGHTLAVNQDLTTNLAPTQVIASGTILALTSSAQNLSVNVYYEVSNAYAYDGSIATNYVNSVSCSSTGTVGSPVTVLRSVGLASKSFIVNKVEYLLVTYGSAFQPTYFLINGGGNIIAKLAYANGGGYVHSGLPNASVTGNEVQIPYLYKDLIESVNKTQGAATTAGIYSQTGVNLASFTLSTAPFTTAEIANNLHLSGGILWMYDGYTPVEHLFHLWPDSVKVTTVTSGGGILAQQYFYVATYEWSDNQGNIFRSAPSIPVSVTTTGSTSTNTIKVPTLRLTYKIANPVKIVLYRWSTGQETYYQVTSLTVPTLNDPTVDYVTITDTSPDTGPTGIIGNNILYTTGGVVENVAAPASRSVSLFQSRLFLVPAEDPNQLWFSKQVIENTPVETSDLLTMYVAPTAGAQGSTGPLNFSAPLDDKLILFKDNALYYINGTGPDNTGANNQFSEPQFITSTVGSNNPNSVVFVPQGLMFQSDKGIWLLGRDLSTTYIGAPVENYNDFDVLSTVNVPNTNQVRFTLSNGITLMYDYFFNQWGTFNNVPAISSTIFQGLHTFINQYGQVFQETPGAYLDGARPVLLSFTTSWMNLAGLQGYERAYFFYILATYISPHKLTVQIAYDYNPAPTQTSTIIPDNYSGAYGSDPLYGTNTYGGNSTVEQHRVFFQRQRCEAFQLTITESYDASIGVPAGGGLAIHGLNLVIGGKKSYPANLKPSKSVG